MFIAEATIDLKNIKIFDKFFNISASKPFLARDGILHEQIKAGNIIILAESSEVDNSFIDDYISFKNENNKNIFDMLLVGEGSSRENVEKENRPSRLLNKDNLENKISKKKSKKGVKKQCKRK